MEELQAQKNLMVCFMLLSLAPLLANTGYKAIALRTGQRRKEEGCRG
jgi:hypothetical protein